MEDLSVDGNIILNVLRKYDEKAWTVVMFSKTGQVMCYCEYVGPAQFLD